MIFKASSQISPMLYHKAEKLQIETLTAPIIGRFHHTHCSAVVEFATGERFIVFFWAKKEAARHQALYACRWHPELQKWSPPFFLNKDSKFQFDGNPVLWIAPDTRKLWLFYCSSFGGWSTCNLRARTSDDRGLSWSPRQKLHSFISRVPKNPPIMTSKGWYVLPATIEFRDCIGLFFVSKDQGKTWVESTEVHLADEFIPPEHKWGRSVDQPTLIEREDGSLYALFRAYKPIGKMLESVSEDGGLTWTPAVPSTLPNPDGGFCMIRLKSGNVLVIYNHAPAPPHNESERNPLSVALSEDEGRTWKYRRNLCEYHAPESETLHNYRCTFQYPTCFQGPTGTIHATWSFARTEVVEGESIGVTDIQYTQFTENWIKESNFFEEAWELKKS